MLSVFATHSMLGSPEALRYTEQLCAQVAALPEGRRGKRILWLHTLPHWQDSLRALLNFRPDVEDCGVRHGPGCRCAPRAGAPL